MDSTLITTFCFFSSIPTTKGAANVTRAIVTMSSVRNATHILGPFNLILEEATECPHLVIVYRTVVTATINDTTHLFFQCTRTREENNEAKNNERFAIQSKHKDSSINNIFNFAQWRILEENDYIVFEKRLSDVILQKPTFAYQQTSHQVINGSAYSRE